MWENQNGENVWVTRKESLMRRTKEELVELVLDMESELKDLQDNQRD